MKKTNHFYRFCALALSCLLLISLLPVTQVLADGDGAIHIKSAEDLRSLAHSCTLDSWSRGKTVVLDNDIELTDDDELPIPTFGGTFNGNGHTISGLSITQSVSPAGLFGVLQKDAVIKNLNVEGTVTPSGDSENIGGIVGENHGTIESCTFNGSVSGKRSVGGIAGSRASLMARKVKDFWTSLAPTREVCLMEETLPFLLIRMRMRTVPVTIRSRFKSH